jgi:hypothetical protein
MDDLGQWLLIGSFVTSFVKNRAGRYIFTRYDNILLAARNESASFCLPLRKLYAYAAIKSKHRHH